MKRKRKHNGKETIRTNKRRKKSRYIYSYSESDSESDENKSEYRIKTIGNNIWFNCDVDKNTINYLIRLIYEKNDKYVEIKNNVGEVGELSPYPIILHINSDGGDLIEVFPLIDVINSSEIPIHTVVEGCAASAATLMSIAGKKRYITENSIMMIHQLRGGLWGTMEEVKDEHTNCTFLMDKLKGIYKEYTNLNDNQLNKMLKHDILWDSKKCLEYGLVDEIIDYFVPNRL